MDKYKRAVIKGIFYLEKGINNYYDWSEKLIKEFGSEIQSQLKYIRKWSVALKRSILKEDYNIKLNCWQFMGCEFDNCINFRKVSKTDSGICPVLSNEEYNNINYGINAGRSCWLVLYTKCYGNLQKNYYQKIMTCSTCEFYNLVKEEEGIATDLHLELNRLSFLK